MSSPSLVTILQPRQTLNSAQIAMKLASIDVHFLQVERTGIINPEVKPEELVISLVTSGESRIRLALIPLLLRHSCYSTYVQSAVAQIPIANQITLKCYYTAARFLQQKYSTQLEALLSDYDALPDLFADNLGLAPNLRAELGLMALANRHRQLSDRKINWLGTYEHGAKRFLASSMYRKSWKQSQKAKFTSC